MTFAQIIDVFHGARYVHVDKDNGVFFVWHGGPTVNIYGMAGEALDCFTLYGPGSSGGDPSFGQVRAEMELRIDETMTQAKGINS